MRDSARLARGCRAACLGRSFVRSSRCRPSQPCQAAGNPAAHRRASSSIRRAAWRCRVYESSGATDDGDRTQSLRRTGRPRRPNALEEASADLGASGSSFEVPLPASTRSRPVAATIEASHRSRRPVYGDRPPRGARPARLAGLLAAQPGARRWATRRSPVQIKPSAVERGGARSRSRWPCLRDARTACLRHGRADRAGRLGGVARGSRVQSRSGAALRFDAQVRPAAGATPGPTSSAAGSRTTRVTSSETSVTIDLDAAQYGRGPEGR
jgi:hypothetical protein